MSPTSKSNQEVEMLLASTTAVVATVVALGFTIGVIGVVAYGLVRPFTHFNYRRPSGKLFKPLD
jgi:hypothetical protein